MSKALKSLVSNIGALIAEKGWSQNELSRRSGVPQPHVNAYLNERTKPGIEAIEAMASALGVSVAALIGDEKPVAAPPRAPTPEELTIAMLERFGLGKQKLEAIGLILGADDDDVGSVLVGLKRNLGTASKGKTTAG